MLNERSIAICYVGTMLMSKNKKIDQFIEGIIVSEKAMAILAKPTAQEEKRELAMAKYRLGVNLGKWAEARGIAASLGKWKPMKRIMKSIIADGFASLEDFGANRFLGRAYYKLPAPLGSKKKSLESLGEAYKKTIDAGQNVSRQGLNVLFLAETFISMKNKNDARKILTKFIAVNGETFNPARIPETKKEQADARDLLNSL